MPCRFTGSAIASNEQFGRIYDRIAALVNQHRSTIVFVNTRRLVERAAAALEQRLGEDHVVAHHGSMSRALRRPAQRSPCSPVRPLRTKWLTACPLRSRSPARAVRRNGRGSRR